MRKKATIEYWNNEKLQKQSDKNIYADYLKGVANGYFDKPVRTLGLKESNFLKSEVNKLPYAQHTILHLFYWKNKSESEISDVLNMDIKEVKRLHEEALRSLRKNYFKRLLKSKKPFSHKGERELLAAI